MTVESVPARLAGLSLRGRAYLLLLLTVFATTCTGQAPAQKVEAGEVRANLSAIGGQVLNATTGEPLRGARVSLELQDSEEEWSDFVTTDATGKFLFPSLQAGSYRLSVQRAGYLTQEYGESPSAKGRRKGSPIRLQAGTQMRDLVFRMQPGGVITGKVLDQNGDPLAEVDVQVWQVIRVGQERMFTPMGQGRTDDRGEYRIYGLTPGTYVVAASPAGPGNSVVTGGMGFIAIMEAKRATGRPSSQAREVGGQTFYLGATDAKGATSMEIAAGQEMSGIDIQIVPVRVFAVRGNVTTVGGVKPDRVEVVLWEKDNRGAGMAVRPGPDGTFEIQDVRPGTYRLQATVLSIGEESNEGTNMSAQQNVVVGGADVSGLSLALGGGTDVSGSVKMEGGKPLPRNSYVMLWPQDGEERFRSAQVAVEDDGTFSIKKVPQGAYTVVAGFEGRDSGGYVKEVRLGGRDVRNSLHVPSSGALSGLEIVMGTEGSVVSGRVLDKDSLPAVGVSVLLVPPGMKPNHPDIKTVQTDHSGHFEIKGVRPGDYRLLALEMDVDAEIDLSAFGENAWTELVKNGKSIQVTAAGRTVVEIQVLPPEKP